MRILRISLDLDTHLAEFKNSADLLNSYGHNFGNLAFVYASSILFPGEHVIFSEKNVHSKSAKDFDLLLFPAANNLNPSSDLGWLANIMERFPIPTLIVGMGLQAPLDANNVELPKGSIRFLNLIKERGIPIGVRGEITKQFLQSWGLSNVVVTGCPSNFLNPNPALGDMLAQKYKALATDLDTVALNLEYFRLDGAAVQKIVNWGRLQGGGTIFQSDENIISLIRGDVPSPNLQFIKYAAKYFLGTEDIGAFRRWLSLQGRVFFHAPSWIDFLRAVSFSTGTRFHGNMLAIQAGTPAMVLYHDKRTLEMSETMKIPHMPWKDFDSTNFRDVISNIRFDAGEFNSNRRMLARRLIDVANEVRCPTSEGLQAIANSA